MLQVSYKNTRAAFEFEWDSDSNPQLLRPVWLNGYVLVYKLSGCEFESRCCHLRLKYCACFKQGVL